MSWLLRCVEQKMGNIYCLQMFYSLFCVWLKGFFKQTGKCLVKLDELHDNIASYDVFYYFVSSMQQDQSKFINVYFLIYYVLANTISR